MDMKIKDLQSSPFNPRKITDEKLRMLGKSMKKFGDLSGIVYNIRTKRIIGGHQRIKHLDPAWSITKREHQDKVGTVALGEIETPFGLWQYREVDWPEKKEIAANIAANQHGGDFDYPKLKDLIVEIDDGEFDLDLIGFGKDELSEMFGVVGNKLQDAEPQIDRAEELNKVWQVKTGDLWQIGQHRLLCGDSTVKEDVERVIKGEKIDMFLTDPPYCSGGFQEVDRASGSIGTVRVGQNGKKYAPRIHSDMLSSHGYCALIKAVFVAWKPSFVYMFTDWRMWVQLFDVMESSGYGVRNMIVWDKGFAGMGHGWRSQHELIMFGAAAKTKFDKHKSVGNVLYSKRTGNPYHFTQKPVDIISTILKLTDFCEIIGEPFAGSGTTGIACQNLGRQARMIEIVPDFCAVTLQRMADAFPGIEIKKISKIS